MKTVRNLWFGSRGGIVYSSPSTGCIKNIGFDGSIYYWIGDGRKSGPDEIEPDGFMRWFVEKDGWVRVMTPDGTIKVPR